MTQYIRMPIKWFYATIIAVAIFNSTTALAIFTHFSPRISPAELVYKVCDQAKREHTDTKGCQDVQRQLGYEFLCGYAKAPGMLATTTPVCWTERNTKLEEN